jgi:uncharacterized protein YbjT (DUF2867 family)
MTVPAKNAKNCAATLLDGNTCLVETLTGTRNARETMRIVVIGGAGVLGAKVVQKLSGSGHDAIAASPRTGVNAVTGEGLADVLRNAAVVVDVANAPNFDDGPVMDFFTKSTANLLERAKAAEVGHYVVVSIVGCDQLPASGYLRAKVAQEKLVAASDLP